MSSNRDRNVARRALARGTAICLGFAAFAGPALAAQDEDAPGARATADDSAPDAAQQVDDLARTGEPPARIDLSVTVPRGDVNEAQFQECLDDADAGSISGEILVCRRRGEDATNFYSGSRLAAQKRYARETAFAGDPQAPDVAGGGIFKGPATVSGQCFIPPCPPEAAILIDVEALPEAPPGSDADRIARGLPPLGQDEKLSEEEIRKRREALGLPPPTFAKDE